jgi:lysophospholipase L1-like esterase
MFALIPVLVLVTTVEITSAVIARSMDRSLPSDAMKRMKLPHRAVVGSLAEPLVVVCAGDSWTYGFGVEEHQSYPAQLQGVLERELGAGLVVNLGNQGAPPIRVSRALTGYLYQGRADLVVYLAGENTPENRVTLEDKQRPAPLRALRPYLRYLATYRLLSQVIARGRILSDPYLADWSNVEEEQRFSTGTRADLQHGLESIQSNMVRMADIAETAGSELLVLTYALPKEMESARGTDWYRFPEVNEAIRTSAADNGLPVLDLEAKYRDEGRGAEVILYGTSRMAKNNVDLHPNPEGYRIVAEAVGDWIVSREKMGLLGRAR